MDFWLRKSLVIATESMVDKASLLSKKGRECLILKMKQAVERGL